MKFYLGTHQINWLWDGQADYPLCVAWHRLETHAGYRAATAQMPYILDSGAFSEIVTHGRWRTTAADYAGRVRHWCRVFGTPQWVAPQDWMCEPGMIARTGLSVRIHQDRTVRNYLELRSLLPGLVIPVLQGYTLGEYQTCADLYRECGVKLEDERVVGVGSVCRRQRTEEIADVFHWAHAEGFDCHGFGVKMGGIDRYGHVLASADSMAWCIDAGYADPLPGCHHKNCSNCPIYARRWRAKLLKRIAAF